ncbi:actinin alpha 2 [Entomortierella beljakovae]|nr:actinin alpha 2 [Entomortierella beljakovae]
MAWQLKNKRLQPAGTASHINSINSGSTSSHTPLNTISSSANAQSHLSSHLESGDDMVRQFAASQIDTQKTTFMRWVNVQLATTATYGPMITIEKDLKDGKRLIGLLEVISKEPLKPERGNMRIHQMANVSKALAFLEKKTDEPLGSIGNEDIVDGNVKLTLGLIWIIIYRFQIQTIANTMTEFYPSLIEDMNNLEGDDNSNIAPVASIKGKKKGSSQHHVDAKQALLRWVRYQLEDYSDIIPPVQDFHKSWRTGLAFAALIHRHDPNIIPDFYTDILQAPHETVEQWQGTLTKAFDSAFEGMNIPKLLDPEDLVDMETPDERSVMTYVSEYYLIMSKHQQAQAPEIIEELRTLRTMAKDERVVLAGEEQQAKLRKVKEEEVRKKREEQDELERIRLRRMEIEGWSIQAAERAREEEEARRKRKEEEEEKSRQRQLRREQRDREHAMLLQKAYGSRAPRKSISENPTDSGISESDNSYRVGSEPLDPEEFNRRQTELDAKFEHYIERTDEILGWLERHDNEFPETPDITEPLDRTRDVDPFRLEVEQKIEKQAVKAQIIAQIHSSREELLDYESPELSQEQISEVDKRWSDIDTIWTSFNEKITAASKAIQEMQWIVQCSQEIEHILGDIQRFEEQFKAAAEKRSQDTLQDRSQFSLLERQDTNLITINAVLRRYIETLSSLLDSTDYTAPEYLSQQKERVGSELIPQLNSVMEAARHGLSNDRLLGVFLTTLESSEGWIQKSAEWLSSLNPPKFVSEDVWNGSDNIKEYLSRDVSRDENLDQLKLEVSEVKEKLDEEQIKIAEFRSDGFLKLVQDAQTIVKSLDETHDAIAPETTKAVQGMMQDVNSDLDRIDAMLPRELNQCDKAMRVLEYLYSVRSVLSQLEAAFSIVNDWVLPQPLTDIETAVHRVEVNRDQLEATYKASTQPLVWDSIQARHAALSVLVKDLRSTFEEKKEIQRNDQQMREFIKLSQLCQSTLREFRTLFYNDAPFRGFISEDSTPFDEYEAQILNAGKSFEVFEKDSFAKHQELTATVMDLINAPGSKHDASAIQTRIASVNRLLNDIKSLRVDRERDIITIAECRRIASQLTKLKAELGSLVATFGALDITIPEQKATVNDLVDRSSQLGNEFVLIEQSPVYRHVSRDPSCTSVLKEIREHQTAIQQAQALLQSGLEIGEQWSILWDQFIDRVAILKRYLDETEDSILNRGIATIDGLADGDSKWKKTEDELHEAEVANNQTQVNLKAFQKQRMLELSNLKVALHQSVQLSGGIESLDQIRTRQYHEAELHQQKMKERFQQLYTLNSQEGFQLEILGQRLVWTQQLAVSQQEIDGTKTAEQFKQQIDQVSANAAAQKEATYDVTLTIYSSLAELAVVAAPGETESAEKKIPLHLEVELYEFKSHYTALDHHLEYARQMAENAIRVISFVRKVDSMDSGFVRMANDLIAEQEARPHKLEKLNAIRVELKDLTEEAQIVVKLPKPSDKIIDIYSASQYLPSRATLEKILRTKLEKSNELNNALEPLLLAFKSLLAYQDGLRKLSAELDEHDRWITRSGQKVQTTHEQIKQMFSTWPGNEIEQLRSQTSESMVVFDVDEQVMVDELDVLLAEMDKEASYVREQKQEFAESCRKIEIALENTTVHSKQIQAELEWHIDSIARKIQQLKTDIRTKTLQLQALEKRAAWEKEIEKARSWFKDFAKAVILFAREQVKWRSSHKEFDDSSSMRSVRTTASRLVIDRLGLSVIEFEEQVEIFETESRPSVDRAWSELCSALVHISRSMPDEFQYRQNALGREFEEIRKQVLYSAQIVTQRKSLETVALRLEELEGYDGESESKRFSISSRWTAAPEPIVKSTKAKKSKDKGWSRFQAKVKKLTGGK